MSISQRITAIEPLMLQRHQAQESVDSSRAAGDRNDPVRLHRGVYVRGDDWQALRVEDRHLAVILAVQHSAGGERVFSHSSAAVLHNLPLYGSAEPVAHVTQPRSRGGVPLQQLVRHRTELADEDIVSVAGVLCTSPERTLLDLSRSGATETALACADSYLRQRFRVNQHIDFEPLGNWRDEMRTRVEALRGQRGVRLAERMLLLADPRKDSVLESVSHLRLVQLGFEVHIQVPVSGPKGPNYYVDFEFVGLDLFGECDGRSKYSDERQLGDLTPEQVLYREKRRQEWICGTTGKRMVRWGYVDVASTRHLARLLRAYGVPAPRLFAA